MALFNGEEFPQTESYANAQRKKRRWLPTILVGGSIAVLLLAVATPLWMPGLLRAVIPDRYLAAYLPDSLQAVVFEQDPSLMLPTAPPVGDEVAGALLEGFGPADADSPTPVPDGYGVITPAPPEELDVPSEPDEEAGPTPGFVQAEPEAQLGPIPPSTQLEEFTHTYQGWNNCGPATLTTLLSYYSLGVTQDNVANFVKPNPEDRNVRPDELQAYVASVGYEMIVRVNGDLDLLKRFIASGYPVIVEKGFDPEPDRLGWMGHYLLLTGYSDQTATFTTMDSYLGPNRSESYDHIDRMWRHFNRLYLVAYHPSQAAEVAAIVGPDMDDFTMFSRALQRAQAEVQQNPDDPFGWFNVGTNLVALGDYNGAAAAFDLARARGTPWRMLWYQFGPYEAYLGVGGDRLTDVRTLADTVIYDNIYSEEAYYYKGLAYLAGGDTRAARAQFNRALSYNTNYHAAREALNALGDS